MKPRNKPQDVYVDEELARALIRRAYELGYHVEFDKDGRLLLGKPEPPKVPSA